MLRYDCNVVETVEFCWTTRVDSDQANVSFSRPLGYKILYTYTTTYMVLWMSNRIVVWGGIDSELLLPYALFGIQEVPEEFHRIRLDQGYLKGVKEA